MLIKRFTITVKEWAGKRMWIRRWLPGDRKHFQNREISEIGTGPTVVAEFPEGLDLGENDAFEISCKGERPLIFVNNVIVDLNGHTCAESIGLEPEELNYDIQIELAKPVDRISFKGSVDF